MNLRTKNVAITVLTAALMTSGIITTANAAQSGTSSGIVTIQKGYTVDSDIETIKTTATGSNAYITFNSTVPTTDKIIVYIKNKNDNIVSTSDGRWMGVSAGTRKTLTYLSGKGKEGNPFYPSFSLDNGSQSSTLRVSYIFQP